MSNQIDLVNAIKDNDLQKLKILTQDIENIAQAIYSIQILDDSTRKNTNNLTINEDGLTLLHVSAYYDSLNCFIYLYQEKGISLQILSAHSFLPLHYACWNGSTEVALYILTQDPSQASLHPDGIYDLQLLYCATRGGDTEILESLFEHGASLSDRWNNQEKIIRFAIDRTNKDILKILYDHYTPNNNNNYYNNDLMLKYYNLPMKAVINQDLDAFKILYKGTNDIVSFKDNSQKYTSLIEVICTHDNQKKEFKQELLTILQDNPSFDFEPPQDMKIAGLCHWGCIYGDLDVMKAMTKLSCFRPNRLDSHSRVGPAYLANKGGDSIYDILELLIQNGFNINIQQKPSLLESFTSAVHKNYNAIRFLINHGADINALHSTMLNKNKNPLTLYESVMIQRNGELKKIFKEAKAIIDAKNK